MATVVLGSFLLLLVASYLIARPFIWPQSETPEPEDSELVEEKEKLLAEIRELDMDFATGKLTEDDYGRLRARSLAQAAATMQAIEESAAREPVDGPPAPTASAALTGDGDGGSGASLDEVLEREIAARREALEEHVCPGCGAPHHPEDRFCRLCGAQLAATGGR